MHTDRDATANPAMLESFLTSCCSSAAISAAVEGFIAASGLLLLLLLLRGDALVVFVAGRAILDTNPGLGSFDAMRVSLGAVLEAFCSARARSSLTPPAVWVSPSMGAITTADSIELGGRGAL